jgi:hypothetical protein
MSGGIITENNNGGVHSENAVFNMSGGTITGNTAAVGSDVHLAIEVSHFIPGTFNLSGNAKIGNISLIARNPYGTPIRTPIAISGAFTGEVASVDFTSGSGFGLGSHITARELWVNGSVITGTLTPAILQRFTLGSFIGSDGTQRITGYHLYGTKTGETDTGSFGRLVAD